MGIIFFEILLHEDYIIYEIPCRAALTSPNQKIPWKFPNRYKPYWRIPLLFAAEIQYFSFDLAPNEKFPGNYFFGGGQLDPAPNEKFPGNFYIGSLQKV